jgi:hypothetical protein
MDNFGLLFLTMTQMINVIVLTKCGDAFFHVKNF